MEKKTKPESQLRDQIMSTLVSQNKILKREIEKSKLDQRNVSNWLIVASRCQKLAGSVVLINVQYLPGARAQDGL